MKKAGKLIIVTLLILSGLTAGAYFFLKGREGGPSNEFKKRMEAIGAIIEVDDVANIKKSWYQRNLYGFYNTVLISSKPSVKILLKS